MKEDDVVQGSEDTGPANGELTPLLKVEWQLKGALAWTTTNFGES